MRYIPLSEYNFPKMHDGQDNTKWVTTSQEILIDLVAQTDKFSRDQLIDKKSKHWLKLRRFLLSLSHGKCWFSEARNNFAILEVEHFRPKKSVKRNEGLPELDGYWWLAFDWQNYRMCAKIANGKKGVLFPLGEYSPTATYGGLSLDNEVNIFLDPTKIGDPELLSFNEDGKAVPYDDSDEISKNRVELTVKHLNLDFERLAEARRAIWNRCRILIEECREIAILHPRGPAEEQKLRMKKIQLKELFKPESEFSSVAITCVLKSNIGWAIRLVQD